MIIVVGRIVLDYFNNNDVADKKKKLKDFCKDMRKALSISIEEVADFDDPERCVIGFAGVLPDQCKEIRARQKIEDICRTIDQTSFARVMVEDCDILGHGHE